MSFGEFVLWLGSAPAIGVLWSYLFQGLKFLFPKLEDLLAKVVSIAMSAVIAILAVLLYPKIGALPPWWPQVWTIIVAVVAQLWYALKLKPEPTAKKLG